MVEQVVVEKAPIEQPAQAISEGPSEERKSEEVQ